MHILRVIRIIRGKIGVKQISRVEDGKLRAHYGAEDAGDRVGYVYKFTVRVNLEIMPGKRSPQIPLYIPLNKLILRRKIYRPCDICAVYLLTARSKPNHGRHGHRREQGNNRKHHQRFCQGYTGGFSYF
jgi:hypothetical protein